ncbi:MAG: hypothetical protein ACI89J_002939, partial [Hyphomicrobiaceae bacterium]
MTPADRALKYRQVPIEGNRASRTNIRLEASQRRVAIDPMPETDIRQFNINFGPQHPAA